MSPPQPSLSAANRRPLFSRAALILLPLGFTLALWGLHHAVLFLNRFADFDCPPHWPFSVYNPRGPHHLVEFAALAAAIGVGAWALRRLPRRGYLLAEGAVFGLALVLLTSAIQGVPRGFHGPIAGGISGQQYYHDALGVNNAADFLRGFNAHQPELLTHARTHPPGAVLLFWAAHRVLGLSPASIAIAIAAFSVLVSVWAFPRLARTLLGADDVTARYGTLLLLLLPAVQIYYCATLDAVIAALLLAAAALWLRPPTPAATLVGALTVTAASFLTFGVAWALPVLFVIDLARGTRAWGRVAAIPLLMGALYALLYATSGFDYLQALRTASRLENPEGFRLLAEPLSYVVTRLENVTEMAVFFGPFLLVLLVGGIGDLRRERPAAWWAFAAATGTLAALFLTGAYHTGETARACVFLYPYLLLPVLYRLRPTTETERILLAALVLAQAVIMQTWGNWFW
jgi:hypothetical protein